MARSNISESKKTFQPVLGQSQIQNLSKISIDGEQNDCPQLYKDSDDSDSDDQRDEIKKKAYKQNKMNENQTVYPTIIATSQQIPKCCDCFGKNGKKHLLKNVPLQNRRKTMHFLLSIISRKLCELQQKRSRGFF